MNNFLALVFLHFIADWSLQSEFVSNNKSKYMAVMFAHCMIYTGVIYFALHFLGLYAPWKIWMIFIGHFCMDTLKGIFLKPSCGTDPAVTKHNLGLLYIDQVFHIFQIIACLSKIA